MSQADPLDSFSPGEQLAEPMRELGQGRDDEAARMLDRLSSRLFGVEAPREQIGRFELQERLGAGAMGVVYAAWDPKLDRRVALKLLRSTPGRAQARDSDRRLLREAKAMARLRHPNVVQVHEIGEHDEQIFVAMELITGGSLRAWLAEPRAWREIVAVFIAAGRGLAAAHDAGLIHRDFKPDNVLIEDERVFVGDFGLARELPDDPDLPVEDSLDGSEPRARAVELGTTLTRTGACVGTPVYMAPELFEGSPPSTHSDQYAFCCSLFEALHRRRPFDAQDLSSLAAAKLDGGPRPGSDAGAKVPRWLERVVERGLEPDPAARFDSMHALLAALETGQRRRRWWRRAAYSGVAIVLAAGLGALAVELRRPSAPIVAPTAPVCTDGGAHLATVWAEPRRARIEAAFAAAELIYAEPLRERVDALVDDYVAQWSAGYRDACEATLVRREQSERSLDLRMRCLDRRLTELDALLARLEQPSASDLARSVHALVELPSVASCAELDRLESSTPLPEDPETRAKVVAARRELATVEAAIYMNAYEEIQARSAELLAEAEAIGYRPLLAEASYYQGMILARVGQGKAAGELLDRAILEAQASGHETLAARAMVGAVYVVGFVNRDIDGGRRHARQAAALLEHLGNPPHSVTVLATNTGTLEVAARDLPAAKANFTRAIELFIAREGEDDHRVAETRVNLAAVERQLGNPERALELYALARTNFERSLGPHHPNILTLMNNTAASYIALERYAEAEATLRELIALAREVYPKGHPSVGHPFNNLGEVLVVQGRHAEAREPYGSALEAWEAALGPEHPNLAYPLTGRGLAALELGELDAARADLERALSLRTATKVSPTSLGETEFILARTLAALEPRSARARELAVSARDHLGGKDGDLVDFAEVEAWLEG